MNTSVLVAVYTIRIIMNVALIKSVAAIVKSMSMAEVTRVMQAIIPMAQISLSHIVAKSQVVQIRMTIILQHR